MQTNYPLIPKQAFLLFPQGKDVSIQQKNMIKRLIFGDSRYPQYTELQKQKIIQFIDLMKKNQHLKYIVDQREQTLLIKMIYANKYNLEKALDNYKDFKQWQTKFIPIQGIDPEYRQKMDDLLKTGVFYCCPTRDQYFKPMIVVHVGRTLRFKPDIKLFLDAFGYFLQTVIDHMMIEGQLQTWNVIVDVDQTSTFSFASSLFALIKFLSRIFIGRMYRCYIVDYPFLIKFVWGTVSLMMDAQQNQKCRILTTEQMVQLIPKQTLQKKYGGDLPALQHFWPLDSPQRLKIQKQVQPTMQKYWLASNKLVTPIQYYERYKEDKIGTKKCQQIINEFEHPIQQSKQIEVMTNESTHLEKLTSQQIKYLNHKVKRQRQPFSIKIANENIQNESIGNADSIEQNYSQNVKIKSQQILHKGYSIESKGLLIRKQVFEKKTYLSLFTH